MKPAGSPVAEVRAAERRVGERMEMLRRRRAAMGALMRRRLSSPAVLIGAAGIGFLVATKRGRWGIGKTFSLAQLGLALLSAARR